MLAMKHVAALVFVALSIQTALGEETYRSAREAYGVGAKLLSSKQFAASQAPFEAALKLMPDLRMQLSVHESLFTVYRETKQPDGAIASAEFLIRNTERKAGRSVHSARLAAFILAQGLTESHIARYEALLRQKPEDLAALGVLSQIYSRGRYKDSARHAAVTANLGFVERGIAKTLAEKLQADAEAKPKEAAFLLKDAAQVWLEAGDKKLALATAKNSLSAPPETRTAVLVYQWHIGLGDVFAECGEQETAIKEYEAAMAVSPSAALKKPVQKKIDAVNAAARTTGKKS